METQIGNPISGTGDSGGSPERVEGGSEYEWEENLDYGGE